MWFGVLKLVFVAFREVIGGVGGDFEGRRFWEGVRVVGFIWLKYFKGFVLEK